MGQFMDTQLMMEDAPAVLVKPGRSPLNSVKSTQTVQPTSLLILIILVGTSKRIQLSQWRVANAHLSVVALSQGDAFKSLISDR